MRAGLRITRDWQGRPLELRAQVQLDLRCCRQGLRLQVRSPFYGDPPPALPRGRCPGLWEYEVVEIFLVGEERRYTEVELGPHGHYLALRLHGVRQVVDESIELAYEARITHRDGLWQGAVTVPWVHLPRPILTANAFAMHGVGDRRLYLAAHPVPGTVPDFHRLQHFRPLQFQHATSDPGEST